MPLDLYEEQAYGLVNAEMVEAVAYIRTSSAANVGADEDSDKRQRQAIESFAKANGYQLVDEFNDGAVSGADPIADCNSFAAMLNRIAGKGVRTIFVESPDRFAPTCQCNSPVTIICEA